MIKRFKLTHHKYTDIALSYCNDIFSNKIISCISLKQACTRFYNDFNSVKNASFLYTFDFNAVEIVCSFAESLVIPDLRKPLKLLPWQVFIYANIYGWVYKDNPERRRFRSGLILVARKNGKTTGLLFPTLLYDLLTSNAAESYMISATGEQSIKSFQEISQIIHNTPELDDVCNCYSQAITFNNSSRMSFFSAESCNLDGYRPSYAVLDEFWGYSSNYALTAMKYGGRARLNSNVIMITTAGIGIDSPCYTEYIKAKKILEGNLTDDSYFSLIYEYDKNDDWKDSSKLIKSNPSLNTILQPDILKSDLASALSQPSEQMDYIAKTCNRFSQDTSTSWIPLDKWDKLSQEKLDFNSEEFLNNPAFCGLDLSTVSDLTVFTLCWKIENKYYFKHHYFIPEETLINKYKHDNPQFISWVESGIVHTTSGATIDYNEVENIIIEECKKYNIQEVAFDRWQSSMLIQQLDEKLPEILFIDFDQSLKNMTNPTKEYERLVLNSAIKDNNPVHRWCISNAVIKPDSNGNYKPMKKNKNSTNRIDSVITSIMSLDRCQYYYNNMNSNQKKQLELKDILACFDY